jgi:transporter family protein
MHWSTYAIVASISVGWAIALFKLPSFKGYSKLVSTFRTNLVSAVAVGLALAVYGPGWEATYGQVSWYALIWGAVFGCHMILVKLLLQEVESISLAPLMSALSTAATILLGIFVLHERFSGIQVAGLGLIFLAVVGAVGRSGTVKMQARTSLLLAGVVISSVLVKYVQKLAADSEPITRFMSWQYVGATLVALAAIAVLERPNLRSVFRLSKDWRGPAMTGCLSALAGFCFYSALARGPLSGVYAIAASYVFVVMAFGWLFFKEKMTAKKAMLAVLSVAGVILMKVG